jgi:hypothetical protein
VFVKRSPDVNAVTLCCEEYRAVPLAPVVVDTSGNRLEAGPVDTETNAADTEMGKECEILIEA